MAVRYFYYPLQTIWCWEEMDDNANLSEFGRDSAEPDVGRDAAKPDGGDTGPESSSKYGGDDDIFSTGDIFANRELVYIGHIPEREKIVGRDEEFQLLAQLVGPATEGGPAQNITINGKTGTGKSLVSRYIASEAEKRAAYYGVNLAHVYIECSGMSSATEAIIEIAEKVRDRLGSTVRIPEKGISQRAYLKRLWQMLNDHDVDTLYVVLDEIDKMDSDKYRDDDDDELLFELSRAEEQDNTDTHLGLICVSNKIEWRDNVDARVDSTLSDETEVFDPYNANELREILYAREDAFKTDVLDEAVIPKIAAHAAKDKGDARKAVDMLRYAGQIAERQKDDRVKESHLELAKEKAEADQFAELVAGSPEHIKLMLTAIARVTLNSHVESDKLGGYSHKEIYSEYKAECESWGSKPLKWESIRDTLNEYEFLGIIEITHTSRGRGGGGYNSYQLKRDAEVVLKALG